MKGFIAEQLEKRANNVKKDLNTAKKKNISLKGLLDTKGNEHLRTNDNISCYHKRHERIKGYKEELRNIENSISWLERR